MKHPFIQTAVAYAAEYGIKILAAIVIAIIGFYVIKKIVHYTDKIMIKKGYEASLRSFLLNLIEWGLKILLFLAILAKLGVETTSFAAVIAAAGLAVGLALQGSLSNFAGGALIMIFKPYKVGDLIEAQGEIGVVKEIEIFTTKLIGITNRLIIIPNGILSNGNIINHSAEGIRRVDLVIGVDYAADIKQTKEVLLEVLKNNSKVLSDPAPTVNVLELADSSVNFAVRPWCKVEEYWDVHFEITESTKLALDKAGIEIPYPHRVQVQK